MDLEFPGNIIRKGLDDDDLVENQKKMNSIIKQIELTETKREHGHKIEKGFFKHENSHEQVLLVLTGV